MFYKNAILLQDFCKVNNIKLLWIAGNGNIIKDNNVVDQKNIEDYKNFKEYVNFGYAIEMCEVAKDININVMCPGYHFSETVHDVVANSLLEKI